MSTPDPDWQRRFGGITRLYGTNASTLAHCRAMVVGIGGVGTWVAEALARSGVGKLTLVDADAVCETNTNRQIHAVHSEIGHPKVASMSRRLQAINPGINVLPIEEFFSAGNADRLLDPLPDVVVDAIDTVPAKSLLLATCWRADIPVVTCGGAGGRTDPTRIRSADLGHSGGDPLLRAVRRMLRTKHGVERDPNGIFHIPAVFSSEPIRFPWANGTVCAQPEPGTSQRLDCASGLGTVAHVTGSFGLAAAARSIALLLRTNH